MDKLKKPTPTAGIYAIFNTTNGKLYVGKTNNLRRRFSQYKSDYNKRRTDHINDYLMRAFDKVGFDKFEFFQIEACEESELSSKELYWMVFLKSTDRSHGYNLRMDSSSGMLASSETRIKISNNVKLQWANGVRADHGEKLRRNWQSNKGRRQQQSTVMSAVLTKYKYVVEKPDGVIIECYYGDLVQMGLGNIMATYHRRKVDSAMFKGHLITRVGVKNEN